MGKINELIKKKEEYIKEKQIIGQKLNKKEQELTNNKIRINDLKLQNELLEEVLDNLKNKENNELRDEIEKLKKGKIDKDLSTMPKMLQDVRKRDDKARTFAPTEPEIAYLPKYGEESDRSKNLLKEYTDILEEKKFLISNF